MRTKGLAIRSILELPEKWAERRPVSGQSLSACVQIRPEALTECRTWLTTWWLCQLLVTVTLLIALMGCGSGSSGSGGGGNPVSYGVVR